MEYRQLGNTQLKVSALCLGTMTFGEQNTAEEAFEQLAYAVSQGINFIDTAEMYPVPPMASTQGDTERIIGQWLAGRKDRDQLIIASKIAGPADWLTYIRGGSRFNQTHIEEAINGSLKRLQTDYIDLYQLHWPDRNTNFFGQLGYQHDSNEQRTPIEETLRALESAVKAGKIRYIGLSNETPWGVMSFLKAAEQFDLPRIMSVQNPYNLLNRSYEVGMAEVSIREKAGLLAYSPLAFGVLSGKYLNGQRPEKARLTLFDRFTRYASSQAETATQGYVDIAKKHGISPVHMALAFVTSRDFVTSNIIGATSMAQLKENIASMDVTLSQELLADINALHAENSNPCP
ncbi:NADP(H)-dependent aldo-keto reductase [Litoribrevibacter albus]|uniref:Protein tas n=1 Tax=Litoribrevibacter albus TaxID=1473156 RepID=A0AA37W6E1_9GAMM|nr:NADP(H)-dependent aldo-keto reductase [Litoribrevibacter albus]GLQ29774.1 oxidoreductase [Litoribrevibacter albus]